MLDRVFAPESFEFFARHLLAGFVLFSVRGRFVTVPQARATEFAFELIVLSLINQAVFAALVWLAATAAIPPVPPQAGFLAEVVALPALLGVVFGRLLREETRLPALRRIALPVMRPSDNAWDRVFASGVKPGLMLVTWKDGTQILGRFGTESYAATAAEGRDLYLETLYEMFGDDPEEWVEVYPFRSIYVRLDDVRSVEFIEETRDEAQAADKRVPRG